MREPAGYTLRPYRNADVDSVVALLNAASAQSMRIRRAVVDSAGHPRLARYVPPTSEKIVAVDAQDLPIGYLYLVPSERNILYEIGGAVHPDQWGRGVGRLLITWAIERATVLAKQAPPGVNVMLQTNLFAAEHAARQLVTQLGFAKAREWVHMVIDLNAPPELPELPSSLLIRPMDLENDWEQVGPALDAAFADHWGTIMLTADDDHDNQDDNDDHDDDSPVDSSYSNAPGVCFIAQAGDTLVGGILCNAKLAERDDSGRIGSMFVRPEFRRQGIGRALILRAFQAFWRRGVRRIILDTDARSFTAAPRFYAQVGMRPYRHEYLYERAIRPGREVRRLG
jgi:GNAT superfamily N-acetyltransferase